MREDLHNRMPKGSDFLFRPSVLKDDLEASVRSKASENSVKSEKDGMNDC